MRYSKEQINNRFQELPETVQDAVLSTEVAEEIQKIGKEQSLHIDVMGALTQEITYVLVGLEQAADFRKNVETYVNVPTDKIDAVVKTVNDRVFTAVREAMKQQPEQEEGRGEIHSAPQAPSALETPADLPTTPESEPAPEQDAGTEATTQTAQVPRSAFANKLKEKTATQTEVQEVGKGATTQNADQKKPGYRNVDPYREPIEEADLTKPTDAVQ